MAVSEKNKRTVWVKAGGRCSICRTEVLIDNSDATVQSAIGDVAHIVGEQRDGPRGDSALSDGERNAPDNLLLLCGNDHKLVDGNVGDFPVERLLEIKKSHEGWVKDRLQQSPKIRLKVTDLTYINVPRLGIFSATTGASLPHLPQLFRVPSLSSLGMGAAQVMLAFERVLENLELAALEMTPRMTVDSNLAGMVCSFNMRFRTKNMIGLKPESVVNFSGDLRKDPHIYAKIGEWKFVLPINPRWITTQTAFVNFTSGQVRLAGLCSIRSVRTADRQIDGSPLLIGLPRNESMDALFGS